MHSMCLASESVTNSLLLYSSHCICWFSQCDSLVRKHSEKLRRPLSIFSHDNVSEKLYQQLPLPRVQEIRTSIINRQLELTEVEAGIQSAIHACEDEVKRNQTAVENVGSDHSNLEAKIDKKKTGLDRGQKRLLTLKKVRWATRVAIVDFGLTIYLFVCHTGGIYWCIRYL